MERKVMFGSFVTAAINKASNYYNSANGTYFVGVQSLCLLN